MGPRSFHEQGRLFYPQDSSPIRNLPCFSRRVWLASSHRHCCTQSSSESPREHAGYLKLIQIQCAITVTSGTIETFLAYNPTAKTVPLDDRGLSVQIVSTLPDLARAQKMQYAAFVASEGLLVVWDDDPMHIIARADNIEKKLTGLVWASNGSRIIVDGEKGSRVAVMEVDSETGLVVPQERPTFLLNTVLVAFTLTLIVTVVGAGFREIAIEISVDKNMLRLAFLALTPVQVFFSLVRCPS